MRRPARRSLLAAVAIAAALGIGVPAALPGDVHADPVGDAQDRVRAIADQLEQLGQEVDQLAEDYAGAIEEQQAAAQAVTAAQAKVAERQQELDQLRSTLSAAAVNAFVMGGSSGSFVDLVGSGGGASQAAQREHLTQVALDAGVDDTDALDAAVQGLQQEQERLETEQQRAEVATKQVQDRQAAAEAKAVEYQQQMASAKEQLGQALADEQARREAEALAQAREVAAQAQAAASSNTNRPAVAAPPPRTGGDTGSTGGGSSGGGSGGGGSGGGSTGDSGSGSSGGGNVPPPSSRAGIAVQAALAQVGVPYRFAAEQPGVAFDCSGLTKYAWGRAGVSLPHQSRAQYASTTHVPKGEAQPGDLIFYHSPISHVGIYIGGGQMVHATHPGSTVMVAAVRWDSVVGVSRPG